MPHAPADAPPSLSRTRLSRLRKRSRPSRLTRHGAARALALTALATGLVAAPAASSEAAGNTLTVGHRLTAGQSITSADGLNVLTMQSDGNLVDYSDGTPIWCTDTSGTAAGGYAAMDSSGTATVYTASGAVAWRSTGSGTGSANYLKISDDGNVLVYTSGGTKVYSATARATTLFPGGTLRAGQTLFSFGEHYRATMGSDGNFVVTRDGTAIWSTGTAGKATGGSVSMSTDGNLVVHTASGAVAWSSATSGSGNLLVMQDDANLVMYRPLSNSSAWASHTYNGAAMTPQDYARQYMLGAYHWGADKWPALENLWMKESSWRYNAVNPVGGDPNTRPYGIPQAFPGNKMAANGSDWVTNPKTQIRWGTGYIRSVYGNPLVAWQHWQDHNWYAPPPVKAGS